MNQVFCVWYWSFHHRTINSMSHKYPTWLIQSYQYFDVNFVIFISKKTKAISIFGYSNYHKNIDLQYCWYYICILILISSNWSWYKVLCTFIKIFWILFRMFWWKYKVKIWIRVIKVFRLVILQHFYHLDRDRLILNAYCIIASVILILPHFNILMLQHIDSDIATWSWKYCNIVILSPWQWEVDLGCIL